ncbi:MAG: hypothetical protein KatS3mg091_689 [Patescibacteria group bacterium]|nr:MAG: hypothetical protein KatS3mg091_689 [Patescibacteria group bacterium]
MIYPNRSVAGRHLAEQLKKNYLNQINNAVLLSILKGGYEIGKEVEKVLKLPHLVIPAVKIKPESEADNTLGAYCFGHIYHSKYISRAILNKYLPYAQEEFELICQTTNLDQDQYSICTNKEIIIVDDFIQYGYTVSAVCQFLATLNPKKIYVATPVCSADCIDFENNIEEIFLNIETDFYTPNQYYSDFPKLDLSVLEN